jgi:hypothetical protein
MFGASSVRTITDHFLAEADAALPAFIRSFYLVGSIALDDYRPGGSDIDFIAVTPARPSPEETATLRRIHARLQRRFRRPYFDGSYVTLGDLRRDPALALGALDAHEGRLTVRSGGLDPVAWETLARHGIPLRGPDRAALEVWTDPAALARWTMGNMGSYWRRWHARHARWPSPAGLFALGTWAPAWGVLGVARQHYTLATGGITSKSGAGRYALGAFPGRWHRIVAECLRIRGGGVGRTLYRTPFARRREALGFMAMVMDDARRFLPSWSA